MKILVIDDELEILTNLVYLLEAEGYEVLSAQNGTTGINLAKQFQPALIISDIMMPGISGYQVLESLRKDPATLTIPFVFLSAKSTHDDIRHGMQLGAEDYISKPFSQDELLEAVRVRLERHASLKSSILMSVSSELLTAANSIKQLISTIQDENNAVYNEVAPEQEATPVAAPHPAPSVFVSHKLTVDFELRIAMVEGREIKLSPHQFQLLHYLIDNAGKIVTHKNILFNVWGSKYENETQYLHVCINQLRQKIEPDPSKPRYIITERGFGYRFRSGSINT
ncbi:MAG: response regulator transcription factor [Chloroflexi bacterium]|uniref:Response regulator transcription factor n=1 Tax=Candidatus Chlorohelix allophototropha TaxID=3003348 RepID=A0A8T7M9X9_9CHLR|nr:response regulator transcription factor [Chloroflexota bacterium]WJW68724.1 response regulator transcription factor [Chloroflexota bacterium L227-S17]